MTELVTFSTSGAEAAGRIALPASETPCPGLLVVHEWWGVNDQILAMTERFAGAGFLACAVDLYDGRVTDDAAVAMQLANELRTPRAMEVVAGAAALLAAHPRCNGKVGVTGFCLGGAMALAAACNVPAIRAALPFYGTAKDEFLPFSPECAPIQGHYAETDPFVSSARVKELKARADAAGAAFELHFYAAGHAFMRASDPEAYHEPSATLAWSRAIPFLEQHLR